MDRGDSRSWPKRPLTPQQSQQPQQPQPQPQQRQLHQSSVPRTPIHPSRSVIRSPQQHHSRFSTPAAVNQLPPIQRPPPQQMSPKPDSSSSRSYMSQIPHSAAGASGGIPSTSSVGTRPGSYPNPSLPPPTQAVPTPGAAGPYAAQGLPPNPPSISSTVPSGVTVGPAALPSISSAYARSPSFTTASAPGVSSMKGGSMQMPHPASSPLHSSAIAPMPRDAMPGPPQYSNPQQMPHPPASSRIPASVSGAGPSGPSAVAPAMTSPGSRSAPPPMHSPPAQPAQYQKPQHPVQPPPPQSPMAPHRTPTSQGVNPIAAVSVQPSPRTQGATPQTNSGTTFPTTPIIASAASVSATVPTSAPQAIAASTSAQSPVPNATSTTTAAGSRAGSAAASDASGRPLNVRDALSYLDMVKSQFQDRPEVYNQFLDIMKDFKSHAIDTPGVIERVSRLFYGNPNLIQGFNTFLPPGYRIECSDDPSEGVRVTTPSGSILPDTRRRSVGPQQQQQQQQQPQAASVSSEAGTSHTQYSQAQPQPHSPPPAGSPPTSHQTPRGAMSQSGTSRAHFISRQNTQQHQQSLVQPIPVSTTQGSYQSGSAPVSGATGPGSGPAIQPAGPGVQMVSAPGSQMEFNHAINYVNKIKMRFASEPEHYKEFLEILQSYQKESRPIHDVYAHVRKLFASAPDLLEEFKQFLPDTSESASAQPMIPSQLQQQQQQQQHPPIGEPIPPHPRASAGQHGMMPESAVSGGGRLPPVGNFTPTGSASNMQDPYATPTAAMPGAPGTSGGYDASKNMTPTGGRKRRSAMPSGGAGQPGAGGASGSAKRRNKGSVKGEPGMLASGAPTGADKTGILGANSMASANPGTATPDELAFFERVKRFIGQPNTYNEFLKLLNLYNQEVLDAKSLVERAESFIGDDRELFGWFKRFVGYEEQQQTADPNKTNDDDVLIESMFGPESREYQTPEEAAKTLRPVRPKADLSICKSYGPSYRLLPASSTQAKCSGRDAMCYEVLNDTWASHPTWASEDTEFVHHKKNQYEEAMFRSEEDRHEMDIEIDTNLSVIRQLAPLVQQIEQMEPDKQMQLTLPENFWGISEALPRRALRKVYDSHRALEIIKAMHTHPAIAIPIVLKRLKQKDEEWRRQRREMSRIWRESDSKNYYRALDHQGLTFKSADRKYISPKHLVSEIETRRREQQKFNDNDSNGNSGGMAPRVIQNKKVAAALRHRYQLEYAFTEPSVIADVVNAILAFVSKPNSQYVAGERELVEKFFQELFGELFGLDDAVVSGSNGNSLQAADPGDDSASAAATVNGIGTNGADKLASSPDIASDGDKNGKENALVVDGRSQNADGSEKADINDIEMKDTSDTPGDGPISTDAKGGDNGETKAEGMEIDEIKKDSEKGSDEELASKEKPEGEKKEDESGEAKTEKDANDSATKKKEDGASAEAAVAEASNAKAAATAIVVSTTAATSLNGTGKDARDGGGELIASAAANSTNVSSKPSTPGLISSRSWVQIGRANKEPAADATSDAEGGSLQIGGRAGSVGIKSVSRAFYTNGTFYVFLRLFQILYDRFNKLREIGPSCQRNAMYVARAQSVASKLGMRPQSDALKGYDLAETDYYTVFLELVEQFLQGNLEHSQFDEAMRMMYGINAYKILTVDKVVQAIMKQMQTLTNDSRCVDILDLFKALAPVHEQSPLRSHIAYRMKVEALVGADEHVFRIDYIYTSQTMTMQLLRREDITLDEAVTEEERWAYYVDSYVLFEPTEGVPRLQQSHGASTTRPYLARHLQADEREYDVSSRSNLEIKIAVNTYKLCFLTGTEDVYINNTRRAVLQRDSAVAEMYKGMWKERTDKWHGWIDQVHEERKEEDGDKADGLVEWWK